MTSDEKFLLAAYLCRHPKVIQLAIMNNISANYFYGDLDIYLRLLVANSLSYFKKYKKIAKPVYLFMESKKYFLTLPESQQKEHLIFLKDVIKKLSQYPIDNTEHASILLKKLVNSYKIYCLQRELDNITSSIDVNSILKKYENIKFIDDPNTSRIDLTQFDMDQIIQQESRIPTGIPWYDTLLQGGIMPGQVYGHLAISGGGKTTFAIQLLVRYASLQKYAIYFTYEQCLWGDLGQRIYACGTNIPKTRLLKYRSQLTSEEQAKIKKFEQDIKPYILFHDMTKPDVGTTLYDLKQIVEYYKENNYDIKMILIDHLIPLLSKNKQYKISDSYNFRNAIRDVELFLRREICVPYNCCALIFHQLRDDIKSKKWTYIPNWSDAAEGKCFGEHLDICTVFSPLDPDNKICYIISSKVRDLGESKILLRLDFEHSRFVMESDEYVLEHGISIKKSERYNISSFRVM